MKHIRKYFVVLSLVALLLIGCSDPSDAELSKGENLDIERMTGTVTAKSVGYFTGDRDSDMSEKGGVFYSITINSVNASGAMASEVFQGVKKEIFDALNIGTILPTSPMMTISRLSEMKGEIIDLGRTYEPNKFFITVDHGEGSPVDYRVSSELYYEKLRVGLNLPLIITVGDYSNN